MSNEPLMSLDRLDELMHAAFEELVSRGGTAHGREVLEGVSRRVPLRDVERQLNSHGIPRWETNIRFYTTDCGRAGYLRKDAGSWTITDEGRRALALPKGQLIRSATKKYREWQAEQRSAKGDQGEVPRNGASPVIVATIGVDEAPAPDATQVRIQAYERAKEDARAGIEEHLFTISPYEFQRLVGHLLTAMGYHVAHIAAPGPDGGVDLIVYKDPLGTTVPRIKVQVKHRATSKVSVREIRELQGLLSNNDEVGLMVSTGGFTGDAERAARTSSKHVDMIDLARLVTLWGQHYVRVDEEGRAMLPLAPIYFLAPGEDL